MDTFKRRRKLHTEYRKMALSPGGDFVALWTPGMAGFAVFSFKRKLVEKVRISPETLYITWDLKPKRLIATCKGRVCAYDIARRRVRTLLFVTNVLQCYKSRTKLLAVQESRILVMNKANIVKSSLSYEFFKLQEDLFILGFENCITIFDRDLKAVYDRVLDVKEKVVDAIVRNRKVYFLTELRIFGHDLSLALPAPVKTFFLLDSFLVILGMHYLAVYDKNLEKKFLNICGEDLECSPSSDKVYVLEDGFLICYSEDLRRNLRFQMIEQNEFYYEKEGEFDTSDDLYRDF